MSGLGITVFAGDSLTAEGDWQSWFAEDQVHNLGIAGQTTDDLIARLPEIVALRPETIVLLIGTNDLAWRRSVEHIVRNIETILVVLRRDLPDSHILLQSVLPRGTEYAESLRDVNRHLWQFSPSARVQWLDLWPALADADGALKAEFSDDQLHLNDAGYQTWLSELRPALEILSNQAPWSRAITLPDLG